MRRVTRFVVPAVLLLAAYFAVFGGEYSWVDLRRIRSDESMEQARLDDLQRQIDSLRSWADSLELDSATIERLARERFGLIRDGETLYRFVEMDTVPDSAGAEG